MQRKHVFLRWMLSSVAIIISLLHLYGAFFLSSKNWGFHQLAFFPNEVKILVPILMLLFVIPSIQMSILKFIEKGVKIFQGLSKTSKILVLTSFVLFAAALFWIGRERFFLLGDGSLVVRIIQKNLNDSYLFKNEPLSGYILGSVAKNLSAMNIYFNDEFPIQLTSILFGVGAILILILLVRHLADSTVDRVLLYTFVLFSGGIQLFFGYVEVYTPLYFGILLFLWIAISSLRGEIHPIFPSITFGFLLLLHLGTLCLLPTLLFLYFHLFRKGKLSDAILSIFGLGITIIMSMWICDYSYHTFIDHLFRGGKHILPLSGETSFWQAYSLFSVGYLLNLFNFQILISPFGLLVIILLLLRLKGSIFYDMEKLFIGSAAIFGLSFVLLFNSEIGMSRDWDILAAFNLPIVVGAAFSLNYFIDEIIIRRRLIIMIVGVSMMQSVSYVFVNADEDRALSRFELLPDRTLWSPSAMTSAYEELGIFYRGRMDPNNAIKYFKKFLEIDSANCRVWGSLAHIYHLTGDWENATQYNERAIQCGTTNADIYLNTGIVYAELHRYDDAIATLLKAIELNPPPPCWCIP